MSPAFKKIVKVSLLVIPIAFAFLTLNEQMRSSNPDTKSNNNKMLYIKDQTEGEKERLLELGNTIIGSWIFSQGNLHSGIVVFKEKNKYKMNFGPNHGVYSDLEELKPTKEFVYRFKRATDTFEINSDGVLVMSDREGEFARLTPLMKNK